MTTPSGAPSTDPNQAPAGTGAPSAGSTDPATSGSAVAIGALEPEALDALQKALAAEHAGIWTYGFLGAFDTDAGDVSRIATYTQQHIVTRDGATDLITGAGAVAVHTEVVYAVPVPVSDVPTSRAMAVIIESDCTNAWRFVIGSTDNGPLRDFAVSALSDASVRETAWKLVDPAVTPNPLVPFPGDPAA